MAPKTTGIKITDQERSKELCEMAFQMCETFLINKGNFVTKIFEGPDVKVFEQNVRKNLHNIKADIGFIPDADLPNISGLTLLKHTGKYYGLRGQQGILRKEYVTLRDFRRGECPGSRSSRKIHRSFGKLFEIVVILYPVAG